MPSSYRIVKSARLKHVLISGKTSFSELKALFDKYLRDPDFSPQIRILADLEGMEDAIAGLWEIRKLKWLYQDAFRHSEQPVDIVIVAQSGVAYRAARAFQLFIPEQKPLVIRITSSLSDAQEILGIDDGVMDDLYAPARSAKILPFKY